MLKQSELQSKNPVFIKTDVIYLVTYKDSICFETVIFCI